jgi:hypothetical protein
LRDELFNVTLFTALAALSYFPPISTFFFPSSFIFLLVASWLVEPVVWVEVAGGATLGIEVCPVGSFAGRVAVDFGGDPSSAITVHG